jgi:hypothetical protein
MLQKSIDKAGCGRVDVFFAFRSTGQICTLLVRTPTPSQELTLLCRVRNIVGYKLHHAIRDRHALLHTQYPVDHIHEERVESLLSDQLGPLAGLFGDSRACYLYLPEGDDILPMVRGCVLCLLEYRRELGWEGLGQV